MKKNETKKIIRESYGKIARNRSGCGCGNSCTDTQEFSASIGYSETELKSIPGGTNLALGCGNPTALANLKKNERVLDLGSGAGIDCFIAANKVGPNGKVIGVDMTPEMIDQARETAQKNKYTSVEFRLGEIEKLPVDNNSIDVVISNCVINLSADKRKVFEEIYRVLKPGGRIAISDIALLKELPEKIRENITAYVGCVGGAMLVDEYKKAVKDAGLKSVQVTIKGSSSCIAKNTKDPFSRGSS